MSKVQLDTSDFNPEDCNVLSSTEFNTLIELLGKLKGSTLKITKQIFVRKDTCDSTSDYSTDDYSADYYCHGDVEVSVE